MVCMVCMLGLRPTAIAEQTFFKVRFFQQTMVLGFQCWPAGQQFHSKRFKRMFTN